MHVIYIRGLGDNRAIGQRLAVALWRLYGVRPHFFVHNWADAETYTEKQDRLLKLVDSLREKSNEPVALVGSSAGASLAINAFAERKDTIQGVVCISGKILHPETLDPRLARHNPAFYDSMKRGENSLSSLAKEDRAKIYSVYSSGDHTVRPQDSIIKDAHNVLVGSGNHGLTIALQITFGAKKNLEFLKQL